MFFCFNLFWHVTAEKLSFEPLIGVFSDKSFNPEKYIQGYRGICFGSKVTILGCNTSPQRCPSPKQLNH